MYHKYYQKCMVGTVRTTGTRPRKKGKGENEERKVHELTMQKKSGPTKDHRTRALNANFNGCVYVCVYARLEDR
jgi:hypothetical protein